MKSKKYTSDGDEIAIMDSPATRYATVFLSQDRSRVGIRLEKCRTWGKPHVVYLDPRAIPQLAEAFAILLERLA